MMKPIVCLIFLMGCIMMAQAAPKSLQSEAFPVVEKTLSNGLKLRLLRDADVPTVSYYTFFKVGSRNERPGITGISHLFEHMMFNGSAKYGPKEFDRQLESRGGSSNAFTTTDMTVYHDEFDRQALSLVIDLESDRMRALTINDQSLASEREVVKEERRFRTDNSISGMVEEQIDALSYNAHPYHWPVIGWMSDIEAITRKDCEDYFKTYYAPNNAIIYIVGDIDINQTIAELEKAYSTIPAGPPIPVVKTVEPEQLGERRAQVRYPAQSPMISMAYKCCTAAENDAPALDILQAVISMGEGGRFTRELVRKQEVVTNIGAWFEWKMDMGQFKIVMELAPKGKVSKAIAAVDAEFEKLSKTLITQAELTRAKNMLRGQTLRGLSTHDGKAQALGEHEMFYGEWKKIFATLDRYDAVTVEQVQSVVKKYIVPHRRALVELVPLSGEGHE